MLYAAFMKGLAVGAVVGAGLGGIAMAAAAVFWLLR
jgi:hypothetical protein